jgi:rhamnosyltransferase
VIVAYHPEAEALAALIAGLGQQVACTVVVNNGPADCLSLPPDAGVAVIQADTNLGVAAAINRGVDELLDRQLDGALLLDQDSAIGPDLVATLAGHLEGARRAGRRIAAIGPSIRDHDDRRPAPFVRFRLPLNQRLQRSQGCVSCDYLITSGCLIDLAHWEAIGPMREAWFIDNIDLEWCFRARRKGYEILGCFDAELDHRIGERHRLLGLLPYRRHDPERLYTMMRNRVFLYRSGAPGAFVVQDALRALGKLGLFSLIPPRRIHLQRMLSGLRDGWRTRPLP